MGITPYEREEVKIDSALIGKLVAVKFLDHSAYSKELCTCRVAGWVVDVTENTLVIAWWDLIDDDHEAIQNNQEHCSLIISSILDLQIY